jgi:hypothetical protein
MFSNKGQESYRMNICVRFEFFNFKFRIYIVFSSANKVSKAVWVRFMLLGVLFF